MPPNKPGPLSGLVIVEMAGIGPVPLAGLILSEMGARVVRVERLSAGQPFLSLPREVDLDRHGREVLRIDLKRAEGTALLLDLIARSDVLIEGFRPGVMERLGAGPAEALARNPRLVYGRMTGFGQDGPLARRAGHDLTYLALTGALHAIGPRGGRPVPPLNLVADYGGGSMFLIAGVLAALLELARSGKGQVVDAAMIDGASMLAAPYFGFLAAGIWTEQRGSNLLDSGAPFYDTYECACGGHVAVACLEPQFFADFCRLLPLDPAFTAAQYDRATWPDMREAIAARLAERGRDDWADHFEDSDACVTPVLTFRGSRDHPHNRARTAHLEVGGLTRPSPAPRFERTPGAVSAPPLEDAASTLRGFGLKDHEIEDLAQRGIVGR